MKPARRTLLALAAALVTVFGTAQAQTSIRFANTLSANDTHNVAARHMAELVAKKTGGKVTMRSWRACDSARSISHSPVTRSSRSSRHG